QRAVFEPLSAFFRSGDPAQFDAAARAWTDAFGLVDALAGFFDRTADPRGRKALFGAMVGIADPERTEALERLQLRNSGPALCLPSTRRSPTQTQARSPMRRARSFPIRPAAFSGRSSSRPDGSRRRRPRRKRSASRTTGSAPCSFNSGGSRERVR